MRINSINDFAVQLQHQAQHAVRCRMLRPEVDVELADFGFGHFGLLVISAVGSRQSAVGSR